MVTRLQLQGPDDWLIPSRQENSRLFHTDSGDRIWVVPPHLGQGYIQEILLQDDLSIFILDYTLTEDVIIDAPGQRVALSLSLLWRGRGPDTASLCRSWGGLANGNDFQLY
ncbi:MAG: hypothetical protein F6K04_03865 [Leptolyngbya sp. SIO4C5]|nr:hypothetical protein [Leptolyngbya sp. SIO4C5]